MTVFAATTVVAGANVGAARARPTAQMVEFTLRLRLNARPRKAVTTLVCSGVGVPEKLLWMFCWTQLKPPFIVIRMTPFCVWGAAQESGVQQCGSAATRKQKGKFLSIAAAHCHAHAQVICAARAHAVHAGRVEGMARLEEQQRGRYCERVQSHSSSLACGPLPVTGLPGFACARRQAARLCGRAVQRAPGKKKGGCVP